MSQPEECYGFHSTPPDYCTTPAQRLEQTCCYRFGNRSNAWRCRQSLITPEIPETEVTCCHRAFSARHIRQVQLGQQICGSGLLAIHTAAFSASSVTFAYNASPEQFRPLVAERFCVPRHGLAIGGTGHLLGCRSPAHDHRLLLTGCSRLGRVVWQLRGCHVVPAVPRWPQLMASKRRTGLISVPAVCGCVCEAAARQHIFAGCPAGTYTTWK